MSIQKYFTGKGGETVKILVGNIFDSKAKTLVNTVNCVGVMGKGVALDFKKRYPEMFKEYEALCDAGMVRPGKPYYYGDFYGVSIINFPTKDHWRSPSKLSYIVSGLKWFKEHYQDFGITSVAFPPLGCGNGGLSWETVGPIMYQALKDLPISVEIYAPFGTPQEQLKEAYLESRIVDSEAEVLGVKAPKLNKYWLLILYVIQKLRHDRYSINVGRTIFQKVCYVITRVGIPTGFTFAEGSYGPYSNEVKSAITVLSNANLMTERKFGKMVETVVTPDFKLPDDTFTKEEIDKANRAFDLLCRVKNTDHAEMIATVLFSYDELDAHSQPTEQQVFDHVMQWKPHWRNAKADETKATICELSALGWMKPRLDEGLLDGDCLV